MGGCVFISYQALKGIINTPIVPCEKRQKLLECPHRHPGSQSDRLDALALQFSQKPSDVTEEVLKRVLSLEEGPKPFQQCNQRRPQRSNLIRSHNSVS